MPALKPLLLSFEVAFLSTAIAAVLGVGIGALLARRGLWGKNLLDALFTAPLVLPPTVLGYYLLVAIAPQRPIGAFFRSLTGENIAFTPKGVVLAASVSAVPIVIKAARASFEGVDPTYVLAARTLGATPARAFFTVRLPLAARGIIASLMLAFARSLGDFGVTLMVAGDIPGVTQTASLAIYDAYQAQRDQEARVLVFTLTVVAIAILWGTNRLTMKSDAA